jgi:hypothetical protein
MKSHELLRKVFESRNPKELAESVGVSVSMIYKWAEPPAGQGKGSGTSNPLDRVEALLRNTKDERIVQWLCERAGGFFVSNPQKSSLRAKAVVPATNRVVQEFADMLSVIAAAALDDSISRAEAEKIRARWEDLKSVTEGFVRCCEQGDFTGMTGGAR